MPKKENKEKGLVLLLFFNAHVDLIMFTLFKRLHVDLGNKLVS